MKKSFLLKGCKKNVSDADDLAQDTKPFHKTAYS